MALQSYILTAKIELYYLLPLLLPNTTKTLKPLPVKPFNYTKVIPLGLEPRAPSLKVMCSTN